MRLRFATLLVCFVAFVIFINAGCSTPPEPGGLPADQLYELGMEMYQHGKFVRALEYFQTIVYNYPGESVVDSAQYYLAMSYFGNEEYVLAEREFNRLQLNYPSSPFTVNAQFMRAVCFFEGTPKKYGLDQTDLYKAIKQFEDFIVDHPESEMVEDAQAYLLQARTRLAHKYYESGMVYVHIHRLEPAKIYFQRVVDDFTSTPYAPMASFRIAELEFNRKNYAEAVRRFRNFLTVFPTHEWAPKARKRLDEAAFKQAELAYRSGSLSEAKELFESFVTQFAQSKRVDKAKKYLNKIGDLPSAKPGTAQADTSAGR